MRIRYQFDPDKATQAVAFVLRELGGVVDKAKLTKLLYIADRDHFLAEGAPISGDFQCAMPHGPVPSQTLNLINGEYPESTEPIYAYIGLNDYRVELRKDPGMPRLLPSELDVLRLVLKAHGNKHTWALVDETHTFPEYQECAVPETSRPIPYEVILKHHADGRGYIYDRAVITEKIARHICCPFGESETGL